MTPKIEIITVRKMLCQWNVMWYFRCYHSQIIVFCSFDMRVFNGYCLFKIESISRPQSTKTLFSFAVPFYCTAIKKIYYIYSYKCIHNTKYHCCWWTIIISFINTKLQFPFVRCSFESETKCICIYVHDQVLSFSIAHSHWEIGNDAFYIFLDI